MSQLNPLYNGKVGVYSNNYKIERFAYSPSYNEFTTGSLGGAMFIPINLSIMAGIASSTKYQFYFVQTYTDMTSNFEYNTLHPGVSIDGINYTTFDFATINPSINILSWESGYGVYNYIDAVAAGYISANSGGVFATYSGVQLTSSNSGPLSAATGWQVLTFYIPANTTVVLAPYTSGVVATSKQAKVFFYNYTSTYNLSYSASYSTAGLVFQNNLNQFI